MKLGWLNSAILVSYKQRLKKFLYIKKIQYFSYTFSYIITFY